MKKEKENKSLKSSVEEIGEIVDEIVKFSGGNKKTIRNIRSESICESDYVRLDVPNQKNGKKHAFFIHNRNVDWYEVFER